MENLFSSIVCIDGNNTYAQQSSELQDSSKSKLQTFVHIFAKYWPVLKIKLRWYIRLSQTFHKMCRWKQFEYQSLFDKDICSLFFSATL